MKPLRGRPADIDLISFIDICSRTWLSVLIKNRERIPRGGRRYGLRAPYRFLGSLTSSDKTASSKSHSSSSLTPEISSINTYLGISNTIDTVVPQAFSSSFSVLSSPSRHDGDDDANDDCDDDTNKSINTNTFLSVKIQEHVA